MLPSWHYFNLVDAGLTFSVKAENAVFHVAPLDGRVRLRAGDGVIEGDAQEILWALNALLVQTQNAYTTAPSLKCAGPLFLDSGSFVEFTVHIDPGYGGAKSRQPDMHYEVHILAAEGLLHATRRAVVEVSQSGADSVLLEMLLTDDDTFIELDRISKAAPPHDAHALIVTGSRWAGEPEPDVLYDKLYGAGASRAVCDAAEAEHNLAMIELSRFRDHLLKPGAPLDLWTHQECARRLVAEVRIQAGSASA